ncbi:MAG: hypothetical protein ACJ788_03210, partial [Ktedonobacteraceae bacterium]
MATKASVKREAERRANDELNHKALVPVACNCPFCGEPLKMHILFAQSRPTENTVFVDVFDTEVGGHEQEKWVQEGILDKIDNQAGWITGAHRCKSKKIISSQK